ncbi:WYL domain-containing protein, partial [Paenibacillus sp. TAF58]
HYTIGDWLLAGQAHEAGPMSMKLRVKLTPAGVRTYERSNGLDTSVRLNEDGSGLLDTDMHRNNLSYFSKYFLSLGADALVEEPLEMVNWIREQIHMMQHAYGNELT